jgi:hypothetical protein
MSIRGGCMRTLTKKPGYHGSAMEVTHTHSNVVWRGLWCSVAVKLLSEVTSAKIWLPRKLKP